MAQKMMLLCDLHEDAEVGGQETVPFSLDGTSYEIDLCGKHAEALRNSLATFIGHARRSSAGRGRGRRARGVSTRERSAEIRAWAQARGRKVSERGRIPQSIVDEYEAAQRGR